MGRGGYMPRVGAPLQKGMTRLLSSPYVQNVRAELKQVKTKLELREDYFKNFTTQLFR